MQKARLAIDRQGVFLCDSEANREDFSKEKISGDVKMQLTYGIKDRPKFGKNLVFAFQQMIAIMAATLLVPILVSAKGLKCDPAAALFGAGAGTIVYLLFTRFKSPVFLGSSFTFLGALIAVATNSYGYWGLIIGVAFAGLVYVVIAIIIKLVGAGWIKKLLPHVIIGPILAIIGLSLSGTAAGWMMSNGGQHVIGTITDLNGKVKPNMADNYSLWYIVVGLFTFAIIVLASVKGKGMAKLIPFIIGIGSGLALAMVITGFGYINDSAFCKEMRIVDFTPIKECFSPVRFQSFFDYPKFTFIEAIRTNGQYAKVDGAMIGNLAVLFVPIAVVELAQHISDHENLSNIVEKDLLENPGLHNTLLGDGVGSAVGAFFGGCANTTYGESISCVALSKNASTMTILTTAIMCMAVSFVSPFVAIINMLPKCVMGGACIAMYGFISVSGLQMLKDVDLSDNRNLYPAAAILVIGIGGVVLNFGTNKLTGNPLVQVTSLAVAMIVGILVNLITHSGKDKVENGAIQENLPDMKFEGEKAEAEENKAV